MSQLPLPRMSRATIERLIAGDDPGRLYLVPLCVSLQEDNVIYATNVCLRLAEHRDARVRGNVLAGLGHLCTRFGDLDRTSIQPIIEAGLNDENPRVRQTACALADQTRQELGWNTTM